MKDQFVSNDFSNNKYIIPQTCFKLSLRWLLLGSSFLNHTQNNIMIDISLLILTDVL